MAGGGRLGGTPPHPPEIGMQGDVIDLDVLAYSPEDDIADDPVERLMHDDQGKRDRPVLDLAAERALVPGVGKGHGFDLQDGGEVLLLHPPQVVVLYGEVLAFYFFS